MENNSDNAEVTTSESVELENTQTEIQENEINEREVATDEEGNEGGTEHADLTQLSETEKITQDFNSKMKKMQFAVDKRINKEVSKYKTLENQYNELQAALNKEPEKGRDKFENDEQWIQHLAHQQANKILNEQRIANEQMASTQEHQQSINDNWNSKVATAKERLKDFEEVVSNAYDLTIDNDVVEAITDSELGPDIIYHLAKNPNDVAKLNNFSNQRSKDIFLAKLELKLEADISKPVAVSNAQSPTPSIKGNAKQVNGGSLSMADWVKLRNERRNK
ncbi:MAG: hypothetical protein D4S01_10485 [Dehalococcoidia bacterium]|nr:MAG: hypothetical protein D4S01_10485 [Dehalococcoidia bacterium]